MRVKAVSRHVKGEDFDLDTWELYDTWVDFSESHDLAQERPELLRELVDAWWQEAETYGVLPLDDRQVERAAANLQAVPQTSFTYLPTISRLEKANSPGVTGRSFRMEVDMISCDAARDSGVLVSWGSWFGGLVVCLRPGQLHVEYHFSQSEGKVLTAALPAGKVDQIALQLDKGVGDGPSLLTLFCNGREIARGQVARTFTVYGMTSGLSIGRESGCPVSKDPLMQLPFTGTIRQVHFDVGAGLGRKVALATVLGEE